MQQTVMMAQTKRLGALAVHSIDQFMLTVPDLALAAEFYTLFGLDVRQVGAELWVYALDNPHCYFRVSQGEKKRLQWMTYGIYAEDFEAFKSHLKSLNIPTIASPDSSAVDGIWLMSPDGFAIQVRVAVKTSPSALPIRKFPPESQGFGRSPNKSKVQKVHPKYLSHILIFTKDVNVSLDFYQKVLGLKLSDSAGDDLIAFVHSPHGSDHHLLAMLKSTDYGFHHTSWAVESIDDVGFGSMQMRDAGFAEGWGVGRHVLGSNYFRYVQDPWGSFAEYSFDIDFVPHTIDWPAKNHPPDDSLYAWGPDIKADFGHNYEAGGDPFVSPRKKNT